jgi:hypothetical protein
MSSKINQVLSILRKIKHIIVFSILSLKRSYRKLTNKPLIYVFGDSHSLNLKHHDLFYVTHVGPATAYKLQDAYSTTQAKKKIYQVLNKLSSDRHYFFLFIFGEIDCRIHINKISNLTNKPLNRVIDNTIKRYGNFLKSIQSSFPKSTIIVMNVLPPGEEKNIYNTPFYPSRELHMRIVQIFNSKLKKFCLENNFLFLSVFEKIITKSKSRKRKYVFDAVHYNTNIIKLVLTELKCKKVI